MSTSKVYHRDVDLSISGKKVSKKSSETFLLSNITPYQKPKT